MNSSLSLRILSRGIRNFRIRKLNEQRKELSSLFEELNEICKQRFADDLFESRQKIILTSYDRLTKYITTKDIISFLEKNGVKRVIIFDFSCCSILNSDYTPAYEPREERLRKRELLSEAIKNGQFWGKRHNKSTRKKLIGKKSNRKNK